MTSSATMPPMMPPIRAELSSGTSEATTVDVMFVVVAFVGVDESVSICIVLFEVVDIDVDVDDNVDAVVDLEVVVVGGRVAVFDITVVVVGEHVMHVQLTGAAEQSKQFESDANCKSHDLSGKWRSGIVPVN